MSKAGLKVNIKKSFFGKHTLEYLGYWISREGVQPLKKKVDAILKIAEPTTRKQLRSFIGMLNYYRDMWKGRAGLLAPLSALTSDTAKWEWTDVHRTSFRKIKEMLSKEVLLTYPNFNEPFDIHTDASNLQLGTVISQKGVPIAFYSRKLNNVQRNYTTTERELLAIVETLKEYRNILLVQQIKVFTDHKNLTCVNFNMQRVIHWRMVIEDFAPEIIYIPGAKNIVADAMSCLEKSDTIELNTFDLIDKNNMLAFANYLANTKIDKQTNCQSTEKQSMVQLADLRLFFS